MSNRGLVKGFRQAGPTLRYALIIGTLGIILAVAFFAYQYRTGVSKLDLGKTEESIVKKITAVVVDHNDKILDNFKDIQVLEALIVDESRGYMRIRVSKEYLNTSFDIPVTLKYEFGRYQPVMLTFRNDPQWGAGVVFNSPGHLSRADVFLNKCIRFSGAGQMRYVRDLQFELYYNDFCVYFVTNAGEVSFDHSLPNISFGHNLCLSYFDEADPRNRTASDEYPRLVKFFERYRGTERK